MQSRAHHHHHRSPSSSSPKTLCLYFFLLCSLLLAAHHRPSAFVDAIYTITPTDTDPSVITLDNALLALPNAQTWSLDGYTILIDLSKRTVAAAAIELVVPPGTFFDSEKKQGVVVRDARAIASVTVGSMSGAPVKLHYILFQRCKFNFSAGPSLNSPHQGLLLFENVNITTSSTQIFHHVSFENSQFYGGTVTFRRLYGSVVEWSVTGVIQFLYCTSYYGTNFLFESNDLSFERSAGLSYDDSQVRFFSSPIMKGPEVPGGDAGGGSVTFRANNLSKTWQWGVSSVGQTISEIGMETCARLEVLPGTQLIWDATNHCGAQLILLRLPSTQQQSQKDNNINSILSTPTIAPDASMNLLSVYDFTDPLFAFTMETPILLSLHGCKYAAPPGERTLIRLRTFAYFDMVKFERVDILCHDFVFPSLARAHLLFWFRSVELHSSTLVFDGLRSEFADGTIYEWGNSRTMFVEMDCLLNATNITIRNVRLSFNANGAVGPDDQLFTIASPLHRGAYLIEDNAFAYNHQRPHDEVALYLTLAPTTVATIIRNNSFGCGRLRMRAQDPKLGPSYASNTTPIDFSDARQPASTVAYFGTNLASWNSNYATYVELISFDSVAWLPRSFNNTETDKLLFTSCVTTNESVLLENRNISLFMFYSSKCRGSTIRVQNVFLQERLDAHLGWWESPQITGCTFIFEDLLQSVQEFAFSKIIVFYKAPLSNSTVTFRNVALAFQELLGAISEEDVLVSFEGSPLLDYSMLLLQDCRLGSPSNHQQVATALKIVVSATSRVLFRNTSFYNYSLMVAAQPEVGPHHLVPFQYSSPSQNEPSLVLVRSLVAINFRSIQWMFQLKEAKQFRIERALLLNACIHGPSQTNYQTLFVWDSIFINTVWHVEDAELVESRWATDLKFSFRGSSFLNSTLRFYRVRTPFVGIREAYNVKVIGFEATLFSNSTLIVQECNLSLSYDGLYDENDRIITFDEKSSIFNHSSVLILHSNLSVNPLLWSWAKRYPVKEASMVLSLTDTTTRIVLDNNTIGGLVYMTQLGTVITPTNLISMRRTTIYSIRLSGPWNLSNWLPMLNYNPKHAPDVIHLIATRPEPGSCIVVAQDLTEADGRRTTIVLEKVVLYNVGMLIRNITFSTTFSTIGVVRILLKQAHIQSSVILLDQLFGQQLESSFVTRIVHVSGTVLHSSILRLERSNICYDRYARDDDIVLFIERDVTLSTQAFIILNQTTINVDDSSAELKLIGVRILADSSVGCGLILYQTTLRAQLDVAAALSMSMSFADTVCNESTISLPPASTNSAIQREARCVNAALEANVKMSGNGGAVVFPCTMPTFPACSAPDTCQVPPSGAASLAEHCSRYWDNPELLRTEREAAWTGERYGANSDALFVPPDATCEPSRVNLIEETTDSPPTTTSAPSVRDQGTLHPRTRTLSVGDVTNIISDSTIVTPSSPSSVEPSSSSSIALNTTSESSSPLHSSYEPTLPSTQKRSKTQTSVQRDNATIGNETSALSQQINNGMKLAAATGLSTAQAESIIASGVAAGGAAGVLSPTVANKANNVGRLFQTIQCQYDEDAEEEATTPSWTQFFLPFVNLDGVDPRYGKAFGALIMTTMLVSVTLVLTGIAAAHSQASTMASRLSRHFGLAFVVCLSFYGPNVASLAVLMLQHSSTSGGRIIACVVLLLSVSLLALCGVVMLKLSVPDALRCLATLEEEGGVFTTHPNVTSTQPQGTHQTNDETAVDVPNTYATSSPIPMSSSAADPLLLTTMNESVQQSCSDVDDVTRHQTLMQRLTWCFVALYDAARTLHQPVAVRHLVVEDIAAAYLVGIIGGIRPDTSVNNTCSSIAIAQLIAVLLHLAFVLWYCPYRERIEQYFAAALAGGQSLLAVLSLIVVVTSSAGGHVTQTSLFQATGWVAILLNVLFYLQLGVLFALEVWRLYRRRIDNPLVATAESDNLTKTQMNETSPPLLVPPPVLSGHAPSTNHQPTTSTASTTPCSSARIEQTSPALPLANPLQGSIRKDERA